MIYGFEINTNLCYTLSLVGYEYFPSGVFLLGALNQGSYPK